MTANTKIEWADHTFNPWIGCQKVGPGCDYCYAEADFDKRRHVVQWGAGQPRKRTAPSTWAQPLRWNKQAEREGVRYRVFCASLADVFDNAVPHEWRTSLLNLIADTPSLDWLLLTKRIGNARAMLDAYASCDGNTGQSWEPWPNVWIGATICNQEEADRDIPKLLAVPAAKRFLFMEPLLGQVDLSQALAGRMQDFAVMGNAYIDWVIVGGESGPNARPMHPDWARRLRDQCRAAGVPFLFKQWGGLVGGELQPNPAYPGSTDAWRVDARGDRWHDPAENMKAASEWQPIKYLRVGKKAAGRLLDGREWNETPAAKRTPL